MTQNKINHSFLRDEKNRRYEHVDEVLAASQRGTSVPLDLGFWEGEIDLCLFAKYPGRLKTLRLFESLFVFMMSVISQKDICLPSLF